VIARVRIDGVAASTVPAADRGLAYGDGLFETLRVLAGRAPLWSLHMDRLAEGCRRLGMPAPDPQVLGDDVAAVCEGLDDAVVRLTWTRGVGPRGYAPPQPATGMRMVAAAPMPALDVVGVAQGIELFECATRLAIQPALAGIKHLNRLEQVLARHEWHDARYAEGLLCDMHGHPVCATAANLFAVIDGELLTPAVDRCGVAGVARRLVLGWFGDARQVELDRPTLDTADEVFLTSSIRGMLPVRAIGARRWQVGPIVRACQTRWRDLGMPWPVILEST
jgi:4-amino-4-deoxychorismate lyase